MQDALQNAERKTNVDRKHSKKSFEAGVYTAAMSSRRLDGKVAIVTASTDG